MPGHGALDPAVQVHILASKYHWARSEIMELPSWERRLYLKLILDEAEEYRRELEEAQRKG